MAQAKRFNLEVAVAKSEELIAQGKFRQAISYLKRAMASSRAAATNLTMWLQLKECYEKLGNKKMVDEAGYWSLYYTYLRMGRKSKKDADSAKRLRNERLEAELKRKKAVLDFIKGKVRLAEKGDKRALQFLNRIRKIIS